MVGIGLVVSWFLLSSYSLDIPASDIFGLVICTVFLIVVLLVGYFYRKDIISVVGTSIFTIVLLIMQFALFKISTYNQFTLIFIWLIFGASCIFLKKVKPTTRKGAEFDSEVEGFKQYLTVAEENRLNILTPPNHTPQLFEQILPYAVALDLEIEWSQKFSKCLENANYTPSWYIGQSIDSYTSFSNNLSEAVTSVLATSVRQTYSSSGGRSSSGSSSWSSGSRGGGSSGGGGGGGGGHGW